MYLHSVEDSHLYRWRDECGFGSFSVDVPTPTEIAELSLRTPRPVAIYLCESEATATNVFCSESKAAATITPRRN